MGEDGQPQPGPGHPHVDAGRLEVPRSRIGLPVEATRQLRRPIDLHRDDELRSYVAADVAGFSINITRASVSTRSFTLYGPNVPIDGSTWVVGAATDVTKGYVDFWAGMTAPKTCRQSTPVVAGTSPATVSISSSFACGIYTVNTTTTDGAGSYLKLSPPGSKQTDQGNLFASFSVSAKGIQPFDIQWELARWQRDGTPIARSCGPCS